MNGIIKGIRTDAWTKEEREVELKYEISLSESEHFKGKYVFYIVEGGVTGHESFIIEEKYDLNKMALKGWCACMGTFTGKSGRWDKLEVEASEMKKVLEAYEKMITKGNLDGHYTDYPV